MNSEEAILKTIQYSNAFDYPLNNNELLMYLPIPMSDQTLKTTLEKPFFDKNIEKKDNYIFLKGRSEILKIRRNRNKITSKMWKIITNTAPMFNRIPFIQMVCVTGSFAVQNGDKDADIDLLVLTSSKRVWLIRLFLFIFEKYLEKIKYVGVDFCFNYILSNDETLPIKSELIAREIIQMKPIYKSKEYENFVKRNSWTTGYYPNINLDLLVEENQFKIPQISKSKIVRIIENIDKGIIKRFLNFLNKIEMKRALISMKRNYDVGGETYFSENSYKGHFAGNFEKLKRRLANY